MRRTFASLAVACTVFLGGCSNHADETVQVTTSPNRSAADLADRYRSEKGDSRVFGIRTAKIDNDVLTVTVWSRRKSGYPHFDAFDLHLRKFLARQGMRVEKGYVLNVYGPDGTRLHNLDTTTD
ncbi:hypothetical protein [Streptomyces silvensis]|nr:hypothetical protein [Streptomyces silvensis]